MDIYVGNLPYDADDSAVKAAFGQFGAVVSVKMIIDHETGRSKGFAFVSMSNDEEAKKAIEGLNGSELNGREIKVNEARPKTDTKPRGNGGGRSFGNGGGFKKSGFPGQGDRGGFRKGGDHREGDREGGNRGGSGFKKDSWNRGERSDRGSRRSYNEGESDWR